MNPIWLIAGGFVLLGVGGEVLVRGAVGAARALGVSPLLVGLTLVGFGTSTPELVTSLQAAAVGSPGIAVGNVVGSNICNVLLILGTAALIRPVALNRTAMLRDGTALGVVTLLALATILHGRLVPWMGAGFLGLLALYVLISWFQERRSPAADPDVAPADDRPGAEPPPRPRVFPGLLMAVGGIALTVMGARLLVNGAIDVARALGVADTVIGVTVVAIGTSLPELVTSAMAALRGRSDLAFGNVVGSNIYNVLGILGVTAIVTPIGIPPDLARFDVWIMVAATVLLLAQRNLKIGRRDGLVMVLCYALYLVAAAALGQQG